jgi:diphosphomevalonate decarboxylase
MKQAKQREAVKAILGKRDRAPKHDRAQAWAATNIALCKYWGKRDDDLNLPLTDSLSIMLPKHGVSCQLSLECKQTSICVNGETLESSSKAADNLLKYLGLFIDRPCALALDFNIPVAAGFASSAACYASIAKALNEMFEWELAEEQLSGLARLGSGSACRSIEPGFSVWQAGVDPLGTDSVACGLKQGWPDLRVGLCVLSTAVKPTSSREGMQRTRETSVLYRSWPQQVSQDMPILLDAIKNQDFALLGQTAEHNALSMHATMLSSWPPLVYTLPETRALQQRVWDWRADGRSIYFTQDAGPNLKLLFLKKDADWLQQQLPQLQIITPFGED